MSLASDRAKPNAAGKPTLYKRIRLDIETRILTGEWPPGHRIPFEHQLMARYRCSRMTVNKALSELAQADLIERRRRAGSFVRRPQHMSAVLKIADIRAEITALGRAYGYQLIDCRRRTATSADRARLGVGTAGKVIAIEPHPITHARLAFNKAASGFFSNIMREPLAGHDAVLPVSDSVRHWHASPRAAVGFLLHAA
uniref:GntR family transcriptional regulator n=1 Tax=uncultured Bradyrhizobium sp. TaxID=199684 RepID=UPI0026180D6D